MITIEESMPISDERTFILVHLTPHSKNICSRYRNNRLTDSEKSIIAIAEAILTFCKKNKILIQPNIVIDALVEEYLATFQVNDISSEPAWWVGGYTHGYTHKSINMIRRMYLRMGIKITNKFVEEGRSITTIKHYKKRHSDSSSMLDKTESELRTTY
jgi:hypothetical protein